MDVAKQFSSYLKQENKTENTVQGYTSGIRQYIKWFEGSYDRKLTKLYRQNILEYISYLKNVKMLNAKSITTRLVALLNLMNF